VCIFFLLNGTLGIDNLNETNWRRKYTWMPCNGSDLPSTFTVKLPSETQVDSPWGQKLAGLKDCSVDQAIQSLMAVKILVGTKGIQLIPREFILQTFQWNLAFPDKSNSKLINKQHLSFQSYFPLGSS
jgi:hypothetical protein